MSIDPNMMPMDDMGGSDLDLAAMQEAMGGGMGGGMGGDMGSEMTTIEVPTWAVPAVEELISILEAEVQSGNVDPQMLMGGGMPA